VEGGFAHLEGTASILLRGKRDHTRGEEAEMISAEASDLGSRLDEHHAPETNGRMAVCRRCGTLTDSPRGDRHVPDAKQVVRSNEWLDRQARASLIERSLASLRG
jgi:hypothetical protein